MLWYDPDHEKTNLLLQERMKEEIRLCKNFGVVLLLREFLLSALQYHFHHFPPSILELLDGERYFSVKVAEVGYKVGMMNTFIFGRTRK